MNDRLNLYKKKRILNCIKLINKYNGKVNTDNINIQTPFDTLENILRISLKNSFGNSKAQYPNVRYLTWLCKRCYDDLHRKDPSVSQRSYNICAKLKKI